MERHRIRARFDRRPGQGGYSLEEQQKQIVS
jgi:hypothetical protein